MKEVLKGLEPDNVFYYFEKLCQIPHGSGNTKQISDYCVSIAKEAGLFCAQDEWNNVLIKKPASSGKETLPVVMLQGHIDMVDEKTIDSSHDFSKDPLELLIEDDWIMAEGTTLGGDDGIAVAYMLAVLTDKSLEHPALECVFTVDEEIGLLGAEKMNLSECRAKYLINIDSEEEGIFLTSCAGGAKAEMTLPVTRQKTTGERVLLQIKNARGGHSGTEIDKERVNADLLMGRLLIDMIQNEIIISFSIIGINGGTKDNAIPTNCTVDLISYVSNEELEEKVRKQFAVYQKEYSLTDPDLLLSFEWKGEETTMGMDSHTQGRILFFLRMMPNGIQHRSMSIENLVETSLNLGIIQTDDTSIKFVSSVRSSVDSRKEEMLNRMEFLTTHLGGIMSVYGSYPGWNYNPDSPLRTLMSDTWERMYGKEPQLEAIHAGVECGIISGKIPDIDIISMGPDMKDIHTTKERLSISSVKRCYEYILEVLKNIR